MDHIDDGNDADTRADAVISPSSEPVISPWMYNVRMVLLWSRDPRCSRPFKPKPQRSFKSCVVAILLLMCGDVESNPGPPATRPSGNLRVGHINPWSCVNKTELILSTIDEQRLDVLAITESYIKDDHPTTIKNDPAPRGFGITHVTRKAKKGGGVAIIARDSLQPRPLTIGTKYKSLEVCAVQLTVRSGRLNFVAVYRPPNSPGFFEEFQRLLDEAVALPHYPVLSRVQRASRTR